MLWVVYGQDGLPDGVFDSAFEVECFLQISHSTLYRRLRQEGSQIARIRLNDSDEELSAEDKKMK